MSYLDEATILKVSLPFLRKHYRLRPRVGETRTQTNLRASGGIKADGVLRYHIDDGREFLATLEATDFYNKEELRYHEQWALLLLDSIAIALAIVAGIFSWAHVTDRIAVAYFGAWKTALLLFLGVLAVTAVFMLVLYPFQRYRYIYAISQFKSYFADEQWIAYADAVFNGYTDRNYKELRRQCIYNGIGLIEISENLNVKLIMAAAQHDVAKGKRDIVRLLTQNEVTKELSKGVQRQVAKLEPLQKVRKSIHLSQDFSDVLRFRRTVYNQIVVISIASFLIGGVFYLEMQDKPIEYVKMDDYQAMLTELAVKLDEANRNKVMYYKVDTAFVPRPMPDVKPYLSIQPTEAPAIQAQPTTKGEVIVYAEDGFVAYDCSRMQSYDKRSKYIIYLNSYYDLTLAKEHALRLRSEGVPVNVLWADCFFAGKEFYFLFYHELFNSLEEADREISRLQRIFARQNLEYDLAISRIQEDN